MHLPELLFICLLIFGVSYIVLGVHVLHIDVPTTNLIF